MPAGPNGRPDPYQEVRDALLSRLSRGRVLDVGCGDGTLVAQLRVDGFEAYGIDLREPEGPFCERRAIEEFVADSPFDAVVSRVSLHHVHALGAAFERMRVALRAGGTFVVQEFDWTAFSPGMLGWIRQNVERPGTEPRTVDLWSGDFAEVARRWTARYGELHAWDAIRFASDAFFAHVGTAPAAYVTWILDRSDLLEMERSALRSGALAPFAHVYVGEAV